MSEGDLFTVDGPPVVRAPLDPRVVITSVEQWRAHAGPKGGDKHWKDGRSAKEVAKAWCRPDGATAVPSELLALLRSHELTIDLEIATVIPEQRTPLRGERGGHRHHDLLLLGRARGKRVVVGVEAKTDESFDEPLGRRIAAAKALIAKGEKTGQLDRIERLSTAVFGRSAVRPDEEPDSSLAPLLYQILAGVAGTLIEAEERNADLCILAVHAFHFSNLDPEAEERNRGEFEAFVRALPGGVHLAITEGQLAGPLTVAGGGGIPRIPMLLGMTTTRFA